MRRSTFPFLICMLALVTAVTLLRTAAAITAPVATDAVASANAALVRNYYDAVNFAIRTGDLTLVEALVSHDIVVHRAIHGTKAGQANLAESLARLHATQPNMWIDVEDVTATHNQVMTRVAFHGIVPAALVAMPAPDADAWGPNDGFRIVEGKIVEQWGATANLTAPFSIAEAVVVVPPKGSGLVSVTRLTFAPSAQVPNLVTPGSMVLAVDTGTLAVRVHGSATVHRTTFPGMPRRQETLERAADVMLDAGDQLVMRAGVSYAVRNDGDVETGVLAVGFVPVSLISAADSPQFLNSGVTPVMPLGAAMFVPIGGDQSSPEWPTGITAQVLAMSSPTVMSSKAANVILQRVDLAPKMRVDLPPADLELLALEAGESLLTTVGDSARVWFAEPASVPDVNSMVVGHGGGVMLTARSSAVIEEETEGALRNASDSAAQVLVLTIDWDNSGTAVTA